METEPHTVSPDDKDLKAAALYALVFFREWERGHAMAECDGVATETVGLWHGYITPTD